MSIFPVLNVPPLVTINTASLEAMGIIPFIMTNGALINSASSTWFSANLAIFIPFSVSVSITIQNLFCYNGSTASGNLDIGIYDIGGNRLVSAGSTAQSGTSALQAISVTSTELGPGVYYMALAMDGTTGTYFSYGGLTASVQDIKPMGLAQMASAFPLPSTATFATFAQTRFPLFGISTRSIV